MSLFLISYNNTQNIDPNTIHQVIKNNLKITDWWHYLPNTYIVDTTNSSKELADVMSSNFRGLLFFIVKVDLNDVNGVLAKDAWGWINKKKSTKLKLKIKPSSPSLLSDYLRSVPRNSTTSLNSILENLLSNKKR